MAPTRPFLASVGALLGLALAGEAAAFSFSMTARTPTTGLSVGDSVVVDIFFDADEIGVYLLSPGVLADDVLSFDFAASELLPVIHPAPPPSEGTDGSQPGYILYAPGPETWLEPVRPSWILWTGITPPGKTQTNLDYWTNEDLSGDYLGTQVTGSGIWIASLVLDVVSPFDVAEIALEMTSANAIFVVQGGVNEQIDPGTIGLSAPILLTPEPGTALLVAAGLLLAVRSTRRAA